MTSALDEQLRRGQDLLDAQRTAMIDRDAAALEACNARLAEWIAGMPRIDGPSGERQDRPDPAAVTALRATLKGNAVIAGRADSAAGRALDALLGASGQTYDAGGRSRPAPCTAALAVRLSA